jgi:glycerol-3-phosphate dehydrogenase (NAD(P)+)
VVPSHVMRVVAKTMCGTSASRHAIVISASKGIENETLLTMSGVIRQTLTGLGGSSGGAVGSQFCREVARGMPTVVTVASRNLECAQKVQASLPHRLFGSMPMMIIVGVELGGAVKNVIAIAAGMVDGLGLGLNTRAALITRD